MEREQLRALIERLVREELARLRVVPVSQPANQRTGQRVLITADDVEAAAKGAKRIVVSNALVTPLARDRAKDLGVELVE